MLRGELEKRVTLSASRKGTTMNLKSMSLDRLANLRDQVNSALVAKVADQRRALESELSKISRFQVGEARTSEQIHLSSTRGLIAVGRPACK